MEKILMRTVDIARACGLSPYSILKLRKRMPEGMAVAKSTRQWLFHPDAIQWICNPKNRYKKFREAGDGY